MPLEERKKLVTLALEAIGGRARAIVHIGACTVDGSLILARHAAARGADALSATPPPVYRYRVQELVDYYRLLSGETGLPFLVYANQMFAAERIVPVMEQLLQLPNVVGCKFTRQNYLELHQICQLRGGDVNVLNGPDETLLCGLSMGADGGIGSTYNAMPRQYRELCAAWRSGDVARAQQLQAWADAVIPILLRDGQIATMKYLFRNAGIELGEALFPARPLGDAQKAEVCRDLGAAGLFDAYPEFAPKEETVWKR
jgi:N-acetylneuraminate lyase